MEKRLGKIEYVKFGIGGYNDSEIGLHLNFGGDGWGVSKSHSTWDAQRVERSKHCKWTEDERSKTYSELVRLVSKLLKEAKVDSVDKLKGIPVEITFDGNMLSDWRILTEVI